MRETSTALEIAQHLRNIHITSLSVDIGVEVIVVIIIVVIIVVVVEVGHDVDDSGGEHEVEGQEGADREAVVGTKLA